MTTHKETPMMLQFYSIKQEHRDKILFYRMGDFYEMFGDDAVIASKVLQIQLTTRNKNMENPIPMCGIPYHAFEQYLNKLVLAGHKVAICEQMEKPDQAKGVVKREVVRVVTPGTAISESLIESSANNYLASLACNKKNNQIGLAFCDLSTGEFEVDQIDLAKGFDRIYEQLYLYRPKEILMPEAENEKEKVFLQHIVAQIEMMLSQSVQEKVLIEKLASAYFNFEACSQQLQRHFSTLSLDGFGVGEMREGVCAAGAMLTYLKETQKDALAHIRLIRVIQNKNRMALDETTVRNLEIFEPLSSKNPKYTLFYVLNQTKTPLGARLLRKWLSAPLLDLSQIAERQEVVEELANNFNLCEQLRIILGKIDDIERIVSRISMPIATVLDYVRLRSCLLPIGKLPQISVELSSPMATSLFQDFDALEDIYAKLQHLFLAEPSPHPREGNFINDGVDKQLDHLRGLMKNAKQLMANLEVEERKRTGIGNLKVKYNRVFGYYLEVSNANKHLAPDRYIRRQTLVNGERYITEELKELEESILSAEDDSRELEFRLYRQFREQLQREIPRIVKTARIIAKLDVLCSFAWQAEMQNYRRPQILEDNYESHLEIQGARHPVIETLNQDKPFIPNDLNLNAHSEAMMLLTGPNMGGKSTYMRQMALIILMAQAGSFVPIEKASLPIFDRIFTRVGATDNLARGQSTFMVEMNETASILNNATEKSFIILDEIGRGTSTFDGISIAWAIVEYLHKLRAFTLFATHYHELTLLKEQLKEVKNYNIAVKDEKDKIVFLYKVIPGQAEKSYGIQVAKLAGFPAKVIERAKTVLKELELAEKGFAALEDSVAQKKDANDTVEENTQLSFLPAEPPWLDRLRKFNINQSTPMEALGFIEQLQKEI